VNEHGVSGGRYGGFRRGVRVHSHVERVRVGASINRVERVMDRRVHHGEDARLEDAIFDRGGGGSRGNDIPLGDHVSLC
jgi:hypothetical protein